ncbi:hypothetical protein C8P64_1265 [Christiangramia gaetbulicola]|uniref:Uncharacterized protein n=1 Tax=Christiangramia gaetbulicola TaxID=703340 RepID=A0A2T6AN71_9FLAO|nr:hypothetical protein [Christiangramia gaetbulicola]PTX45271.1 hypothetical protein C8P64_1265 [Christiangramia gaetbulicola]
MVKNLILLTFVLGFIGHSQQSAEYMGTIKLNDTSFISYKVAFELKKDSISGYSITDLGGAHETKSNLKGNYNSNTKELNFEEADIIYTKSPITQNDFCFVHFTGRVKDIHDIEEIDGKFQGLYTDGKKCLDGEIRMVSIEKIMKKAEKVDRKIQRTGRIDDETKKNISVKKTLDTLSMNIIASNENLNILTSDQKVELTIYDAGKEDDDRIDLFINGEKVLNNYTVTKKHKIIHIDLNQEQTSIEVVALNVGTSAPNTVKIHFKDTRNYVTTLTNLKEGERAGVTIVRR